jgi:malate dehydrogenase
MDGQNKVAVIGAGAVGATLAQRIFESGLADVVLVDILDKIACGKALDLTDASPLTGSEKSITGTGDYKHIQGSSIVVVTAGLARKPGMTRDDLIARNAAIVKDVCVNIKREAPSAILIIVTNPLDSMTYLARKVTGFSDKKVFGMAGVLDGSRFIALIAEELKVPRSSVETFMMGSHGDTMVPVVSKTTVAGTPVEGLMKPEALRRIIDRTCNRGAEIVSFLGTGGAYYAPSASVLKMVKSIINDSGETMTASAYLSGEYGLKDICIGVPCVIGKGGIEKIIEFGLSGEEKAALKRSAEAIRRSIEIL